MGNQAGGAGGGMNGQIGGWNGRLPSLAGPDLDTAFGNLGPQNIWRNPGYQPRNDNPAGFDPMMMAGVRQRMAMQPGINAALNAPIGQGPDITDLVGAVGRMNSQQSSNLVSAVNPTYGTYGTMGMRGNDFGPRSK